MTKQCNLAAVVILVSCWLGSAQAGTLVVTDSGSLGEFTFTNEGISGGTTTIGVSVPNIAASLDTVNGVGVPPEPTVVNGPITLLVTPSGGSNYTLVLSPGDYIQTIGATAGLQAKLAFNLSAGDAPASLPNFFNASGPINALLANANPLYDFSLFGGGGDVNFTFTATTFTGTDSFAGLFATSGASVTAVGNGSFSESAVPEPVSVLLLGLGLLAPLLWYQTRRSYGGGMLSWFARQ